MNTVTPEQLREYKIFSDEETYKLLDRAADTIEYFEKEANKVNKIIEKISELRNKLYIELIEKERSIDKIMVIYIFDNIINLIKKL